MNPPRVKLRVFKEALVVVGVRIVSVALQPVHIHRMRVEWINGVHLQIYCVRPQHAAAQFHVAVHEHPSFVVEARHSPSMFFFVRCVLRAGRTRLFLDRKEHLEHAFVVEDRNRTEPEPEVCLMTTKTMKTTKTTVRRALLVSVVRLLSSVRRPTKMRRQMEEAPSRTMRSPPSSLPFEKRILFPRRRARGERGTFARADVWRASSQTRRSRGTP